MAGSFLVPLTASILFVVLSFRPNASQILGNSTPKWRQTLQYTLNAICHWPHPPALSTLPFLSGCCLTACLLNRLSNRTKRTRAYLPMPCGLFCCLRLCVCVRLNDYVYVCVFVHELTNVQADACRRWRLSKWSRKVERFLYIFLIDWKPRIK